MACAKPTISSTVSPFMCKATSRAAICASVSPPLRISAMVARASWRVRAEPWLATLCSASRSMDFGRRSSVVIALLTGGQCDLQAILRRRQRTRCVMGVGAGRILQPIEVEPEFSRLRQPMIGKSGVKKTSRGIASLLAGRVLDDEHQLFVARVFEDRLQAEALAIKRERHFTGHIGINLGAQN